MTYFAKIHVISSGMIQHTRTKKSCKFLMKLNTQVKFMTL